MEPWQEEGTIGFFLPEAEAGWRSDRRRYDLPTLRVNRFRIALWKSEDRILVVEVGGLLDLPITMTAPLPDGTELLHLTILWRAGNMQLYFDGTPAAMVPIPDEPLTRRAASN